MKQRRSSVLQNGGTKVSGGSWLCPELVKKCQFLSSKKSVGGQLWFNIVGREASLLFCWEFLRNSKKRYIATNNEFIEKLIVRKYESVKGAHQKRSYRQLVSGGRGIQIFFLLKNVSEGHTKSWSRGGQVPLCPWPYASAMKCLKSEKLLALYGNQATHAPKVWC